MLARLRAKQRGERVPKDTGESVAQQLARLQSESAICMNPHVAALLPKAHDGSPIVSVRRCAQRERTLVRSPRALVPLVRRAETAKNGSWHAPPPTLGAQGLGLFVTEKKPQLFEGAAGLTTKDCANSMALIKDGEMTAEQLEAKKQRAQVAGPPTMWDTRGPAGVATKDLVDVMM
eukprot:5315162-Prymnesium_polylepis.1